MASSGPSVSIVIDNFNYSRFLRRSIDSALGQTYPGVEVVVVDDRSTDDSPAIIQSYGSAVVPVLKQVNQGHGAAMNAGFAASSGDIVLFLDADDFLYPEAAAEVVAAFGEGVGQVQYRLDLVDSDGGRIDLFPPVEVAFDDGDISTLLAETGRFQTTVTSGLAFSRLVLDKILPMPPEEFRQGGDGYMVAVAGFYGSVVSIERPLGAYCRHGQNHSDFLSRIADRARWRLSHDAARYRAIRNHAASSGKRVAPELGMRDPIHLEERIVSLTLDPAKHPFAGDQRLALSASAARTALAMKMDGKRRVAMAAFYLALGLTPRAVASRLITWKMEPGSRPAAIDRLAKLAGRRAQA